MTLSPAPGRLTAEELDACEARSAAGLKLASAVALRLIAMARYLPDEELVEAYARVIDAEAFKTLRQVAKQNGLDAENPAPGVILPHDIDAPIANRILQREVALAKARACISLGNQGVVGSPGQDQPSADVTSPGSETSVDEHISRMKQGEAVHLWAVVLYPGSRASDLGIGGVKVSVPNEAIEVSRAFAKHDLNTPDPRVGELILTAKNLVDVYWKDAAFEPVAALRTALAAFGGE